MDALQGGLTLEMDSRGWSFGIYLEDLMFVALCDIVVLLVREEVTVFRWEKFRGSARLVRVWTSLYRGRSPVNLNGFCIIFEVADRRRP